MRYTAMLAGLVLVVGSAGIQAGPAILDPNVAEFPHSSLIDFSSRARAETAGKGFLGVSPAGRFVWPNGRRARFWGINVAAESVFQSKERIADVVEKMAHAGFNLVRIHHIDGTARGIIVGRGESSTFDEAKLDQLDYWIDQCGRRGLAVYLDLLDYRGFLPGDGVPFATEIGRAGKPYIVFDRKLIELQKDYAKRLMRDHVNKYNGLAYADDPAVVMVEIFDENGLFMRWRDWPTLVPYYRAQLAGLWNNYLVQRYGSTEGVKAAWSQSGVIDPLPFDQRAEDGTIPLPNLAPVKSDLGTPEERLREAQVNDVARFAYYVHRAYYREMRDYLRQEVGIKVPLTAVGDFTQIPDLLSVAEELDFIGTNVYWDHPIFRANQQWQMPYLFHFNSPLTSTDPESFAPKVAMAKMTRKPVVVREWNHCFPNPHRAAGMVEVTAYSLLQDVDAMILFTYGTIPTNRHISFFDVHQDPARWGLAAVLGEMYRRRAVASAQRQVEIGYSDVDTFRYETYPTALRRLAYVTGVSNRCFDESLTADADLTIASGRSGAAKYSGGPLLLSRNHPATTTNGAVAIDTTEHLGYPIALNQSAAGSYWFDGDVLYPRGNQSQPPGGRFRMDQIDSLGVKPVGRGEYDAFGFYDPARQVLGFGRLPSRSQAKAAMDMLRLVYGHPVGHWMDEEGWYVSDTGELLRDTRRGRLVVNAPRAVSVAGDLTGGPHQLGAIRIETKTPSGAAVIVSLDDKPLAEAGAFIAKFASNAINTGMKFGENSGRFRVLTDEGQNPINTGGYRTADGLRVYRGKQLWFGLDLANGTSEVVFDGRAWYLFVDRPDTRLFVPGANEAVAVMQDGSERKLWGNGEWTYPADAALVRAWHD